MTTISRNPVCAILIACSIAAVMSCGDSTSGPTTPTEPPLTPIDVRCQLVPEGFGPAGTTPVDTEVVASDLEIPWSLQWLPDGDMLVTQRLGAILRITPEGDKTEIARLTGVEGLLEGGLLGLALHPRFEENNWFYIYYTQQRGGEFVNVVERWTLAPDGQSALPDRIIVDGIPALLFHNGGRLRFGPDGYLYIGTGDAGTPERAQDPNSLAGKVLRVTDEGEIPEDNPFPGSPAYVIGVRNTQGISWREDGRIVMTDHGPSGLPLEGGRIGHDELNIAESGTNLGWPEQYRCEEAAGRRPPSMSWANAMPPGGIAIYDSDEIPEWRGDAFIGVLGFGSAIGHLHRIRLSDEGNVEITENYFLGEGGFGRIRDVIMGPDGGLYFTTSNCDGRGSCPDGGDLIVRVGRRS